MSLPRAIKILVVEDDALLRFDLLEDLATRGFLTIEAECGDDAIGLLDDPELDALFTDVTMPGSTDGVALANLAVERRPTMFIATLTSNPRSPSLSKKASYLGKPWNEADFCDLIDRLKVWCNKSRDGEVYA